jgi:hypothetical protein
MARRGLAGAAGLVLPLLCTACGSSSNGAELTVVVAYADGSPAAGVDVTVVPFDVNALVDSLSGAAPTAPPDFTALTDELAAFEPDTAMARRRTLDRPWIALRDSTRALSDSLFAIGRTAPGYAAAYERFRAMYQRLTRESAARDRALRSLGADDLALARRAHAAADSLRRWESVTFADFEALSATAIARTGRRVREARTDEDGTVVFDLEPGTWWITGIHPDADNPFMEFRWRGRVHVGSWLPFQLPLGARELERVWRH